MQRVYADCIIFSWVARFIGAPEPACFQSALTGLYLRKTYLYYILFSKKVRVFFCKYFFCEENKGNSAYKTRYVHYLRTFAKNARGIVGRGPVPRHATIAGETRSDARVASEGPRATVVEAVSLSS